MKIAGRRKRIAEFQGATTTFLQMGKISGKELETTATTIFKLSTAKVKVAQKEFLQDLADALMNLGE